MVISTIGTFDPDNEFLNDFKGIWDSILDHTREYLLYEHEYISILKMVMKGTAAVNLRLMIRERLDIDDILSAIQDLYVPEQTFFDDYVDINKFVRRANEPILWHIFLLHQFKLQLVFVPLEELERSKRVAIGWWLW